jgi:Caenorhabditis protein of unknown function, DUF268
MTKLTGRIYGLAVLLGVDPRKTIRTLKGLPAYFSDLRALNNQRAAAGTKFPFGTPTPCLEDRSAPGGYYSGHYFHQDLLVARRINQNRPQIHVDVGSRVDGFVAHVASFRPIVVLDIRPLKNTIPNVQFMQADLMKRPEDHLIESCDSLSCLHALEHFGLGRYGDPVNYEGHLLGLTNLRSLLKAGGKFYLSVPIGPQRINFNAHRVFSVAYLLACLAGKYQIDHFSFVDDKGDLHENCPMNEHDIEADFGCYYGCGIFEMTKV